MSDVIEIKELTVEYKKKRAVDHLSLSVRQGEIFGFLGPNGAGKSTTIKTILGLVLQKSGAVSVHGLPPTDPRSRAKIGYMPEEALYYRFLNPKEILTFYGQIFGIPKDILNSRIEKLLDLVGLLPARKQFLSTFSRGMVQRLSLAQALINEPETLILDEPTSGFDPVARMDLRRILTDLKNKGCTIFFSSHELSEVELLCDSIAILKAGRLVRSGSIQEVVGDHRHGNLERFFLETIGKG
jgi:ABC-2 type transport system ATP-binding protein